MAVGPITGVGIDLADVRLEIGATLVIPLASSLPLRIHLDAVLRRLRPNPVGLVARPVREGYIRLVRPSEAAVKREVRVEPDPESPAWKSESEPGKKVKVRKSNPRRRNELLPL